jgi:hypothetical protein
MPGAGLEARLFEQFALRGLERRFSLRPSALRDLPGITIERISVLPDEMGIALLIDWEHTDRAVLELDDAVDAGMTIRPDDLILTNVNPGIVIDGPAR